MSLFVVHYSEVALKGKNRPEFIRALRHNISKSLSSFQPKIDSRDGRFLVKAEAGAAEVEERLSRVFGISWFAQVSTVPRDYSAIQSEVLTQAGHSRAATFRISPRRADKSFPISSHAMAMRLGSDVAKSTGMKVSLSEPDLELHVDVIRNEALVYSKKMSGPGGLPVGTAGRVVHLFSGGIDSPVAAWLLMKRGCRPVYVHFYLAPSPETVFESKITKLVKALSAYGGRSTLILVPFADYQLATPEVPGGLEPSLFRRFMRMTAEVLAPRFRAGALSTGDSLSQAASQTLWNLATFDEGSPLPILRPLLSYDKEEIVNLAKKIGTYELSLEEYKDCCAIISRHPQTRTKPTVITGLARELGFEGLISRSLERGTLMTWDPWANEMKISSLSQALEGKAGNPRTPHPGSSQSALEAKI